MQTTRRLHYIDHLRVAAFAILIAYHSSVAFFPDMTWLMESAEKSALLSALMKFPRAWRLALLFFIAGMGTWFAFRNAAGRTFLTERFARLFVPLIFAMCVLIAPQVWFERVHEDGYGGTFFEFWVQRYFTEGKYPQGNFTWAHMWFVAYLLVMTIAAYPVFRLIVRPSMRWFGDAFERIAASRAIYLLFLLPLAFFLALTPFFPRQTNALYNDGAWFSVWSCWFGLGFLVARHHHALIGAIVARRKVSLALAGGLTVGLYAFSWSGSGAIGSYENMTLLYAAAIFALAWTMILALVGFAALHINCAHPAMTWLNHKVYPLYIVHQTVVVGTLFVILPYHLGVWTSYCVVLAATFILSLAFALFADQLPWPLRALVGLSDRPPMAKEVVISRSMSARPAQLLD